MRYLICQQCRAPMRKRVQSSGAYAGLAIALLVFCAGILIIFLLPVIGWIAGPVIMLCALFMGSKKTKVWRCTKCRCIVPRG